MTGRYKDNLEDSCPFCNNGKEDIAYLFKNWVFCRDIWIKIHPNSPTPQHKEMDFVDWIESI